MSRTVHAQYDSLQPGMTVSQVTSAIGNPDYKLGEITTAFGQHVVVWEYEKVTARVILPSNHTTYWVYIVDDKFFKYTLKGDWQKEAGIIYKTDFANPPPPE